MKTKLVVAFTLAIGVAGSALAEDKPPSTGPAPAVALAPLTATPSAAASAPLSPAHAMTAQDLQAYFDGAVPYALHRADIAGAVITVVRDGQIVFAQGYGYSDLKTHKPVVADQTMFRPGSVSKLFTWTSVMQLVEQGKLDLDRDVNDYLDFKIPEKFGKPITLRNCMTHTAGFEEMIADTFVFKPEQLYPVGKYLATHIPERIFPPGKVVAYSNYATTIAGYIVQRVSGEKFDDYVANHILKPLGMTHSTFVQPLPKDLQPFMAQGYTQASLADKPVNYELVEAAPAGALAASGTDMARFMMAHLNNGSYGGATILKPETAKQMHSRNHTLAPGLNGFNLGFYDENRNGHRIIGHAGDTVAFHSDLHLILDANTGVFMSFSSPGKEGAVQEVRTSLFRAFLDRYFPYTPPEEKAIADPKADAARVAGSYIASRRKESALYLLSLIGQSDVNANSDGTISIDALKDPSGATKKWREVGPLLYREVNGQTHTRFMTDEAGNVSYWVSDDFFPVEELQKKTGLESMSVMKPLSFAGLAVLVLTMVIWFGGFIVRWRFKRPLVLEPREKQLRLASRLGALALLLVPLGWLGFITAISADESLLFGGGLPAMMIGLYVLGVVALIGCLAMLVHAVLRVIRGPGGWLVRIGEVALGLTALYGFYSVIDYGLVNFRTLF